MDQEKIYRKGYGHDCVIFITGGQERREKPSRSGARGGLTMRILLHETIDITLSGRAAYFEHMVDGYTDWLHGRGMRIFGIWGTLGSTGRWPEVINLWEYGDWANIALIFANETRGDDGMQEPKLKEWWLHAQQFRSGGLDRLVAASASTLLPEDFDAKGITGSEVFRHERVKLAGGAAHEFVAAVEEERRAHLARLGVPMVACLRTVMRDDDEAILIWACKTWEDWAVVERELDQNEQAQRWRAQVRPMVREWRSELMLSAPRSPTKTGQQPVAQA